jgi:Mg-chelatase subunit ChlD
MQQPVGKSAEALITKFAKLQEKGQTALGPALLSAVLLAKGGKAGSTVIICTDGMANKGLGSLDVDASESEAFYQEVAAVAKLNGVSISVVTIKGEGCKLEILSSLAE